MNHQGEENLVNNSALGLSFHQIPARDLSLAIASNNPAGHMISPIQGPIQGAKKGPNFELSTGHSSVASSHFSGALQTPPVEFRQPGPYELLGTSMDGQTNAQNMSMDNVQDFQSFVTTPVFDSSSCLEMPPAAWLSMPPNMLPSDFPEFYPPVWHPTSAREEFRPSDLGYPPITSSLEWEAFPDQRMLHQKTSMAYDFDTSMGVFPHRVGNEGLVPNVSFDNPWEKAITSAQPHPDAGGINTPELYVCPSETSDPDPPGLTTISSGPSPPWSSSIPALKAKTPGDTRNDIQESMSQTLNLKNMDPTQPPRRRRFTDAEKERINRVRKEGACEQCRKKHRKCKHVARDDVESHPTSPEDNGPETPTSDMLMNVQVLS